MLIGTDPRMTPPLMDALIAFDGGVTLETIGRIASARPDMIVSGSAVMKHDTPRGAFAQMRAAWQNAFI